jgi:hypothetical protein
MKCDMFIQATAHVEWTFTTDETLENAILQAEGIAKNVFGENLNKTESH